MKDSGTFGSSLTGASYSFAGFYKVQDRDPQTLIIGSGEAARPIRYRATLGRDARRPGLFWLSGFMSDMASTKATALSRWADRQGLATTFFDYSGHGASGGAFTDGTIGRWLEEAHAVFSKLTSGPQIVIGSSMGGYIALLLARQLGREQGQGAERLRALVLIAPAWNMTEELMWNRFPANIRQQLSVHGRYDQPSNYGAPYPITLHLIEDGREHVLAREPFDPECPVTILQGRLDPDVPAAHARELVTLLPASSTKYIEIADGDHRLSRPEDTAMLFAEIGKML